MDSKGKVFGWHLGRKLFLRTCAELGITSWNAQLMCGKAVDKSIATYINGVQLKNDAQKVHNVLRMEIVNEPSNHTRIEELEQALRHVESENAVFQTRIDQMHKHVQDVVRQIRQLVPPAAIDPNGEIIEFHSADEYIAWRNKAIQESLKKSKSDKQ